MKPSIYNSILNFDNGYSIIYNALKDRYVAYPTSQIKDGNILRVTSCHLKEQLSSNGMLVEDNTDEIQLVKDIIEKIDTDDSSLHIHVNPTLGCNFRCWYCYEDHSDSRFMQPDTISAIDKLLRSKITDKTTSVHFSFFGGEPLLYFNKVAKPLIEQTVNTCKEYDLPLSFHFTSNGYLLNKSIFDFISDLTISFQITLDGHRDSHNKVRIAPGQGSYDIIVRNVKKLLSLKKNVILRINYTKENFNEIPAIIDNLSDIPVDDRKYLTIDLQQV